eukprot:GGOE01001502.1.p1 GENE.GGOE01001502.1~~GGOE01001502.1.p1  ORF type:complete len:635 (+),score=140.25 GGOE01001502.1:261-1907(+)
MYTLASWRTFIATIGGAIAVQENVPANEEKVPGKRYGFRSDLRRNGGRLALWLLDSLTQLGNQSGHPELQFAPIVFWGFSREGIHPPSFGEVFPSRLLGGVRYMSHLREDVFDYAGTLHLIPFFTTIGENDNIAKMNNIDFLRNGRKFGNPWSCIVVPGAKHGEGYADDRTTAFQFPWMLELLAQLPDSALREPYDRPVPLHRPNASQHGWLGNMERIIERCCAFRGEPDTHRGSLDGNEFIISPYREFTHNVSSASWLSCETLARVWKETNERNALTERHRIYPVALLSHAARRGAVAAVLLVRTRVDMAVKVRLWYNGTARASEDFDPLPTEVIIPAGSYGARLSINAPHTPPATVQRELRISLLPSPEYHALSQTQVVIMFPFRPQRRPAGPPAVSLETPVLQQHFTSDSTPSLPTANATLSSAAPVQPQLPFQHTLLASIRESLLHLQRRLQVLEDGAALAVAEVHLQAAEARLKEAEAALEVRSGGAAATELESPMPDLPASDFAVLPSTGADVSMAMTFALFFTGFALSVAYLYAIKYRRPK